MRNAFFPNRPKAVTLVELLVVLAIIGLLATIAIPVYVNRVEQAKLRVAQQEVAEIAQALEIVGVSHGYYVPLQMLDDLPVAPNLASDPDTDDLRNENNLYLIDLGTPINTQLGNQDRLNDNTTDGKVANLYNFWLGPFLTPQRVYTGGAATNDPNQISSTFIQLDYPLDPWGTPYRLYSPEGIVGSSASSDSTASPGVLDNFSFSDGFMTTNDDRFDRWAVVSFGPDRETDGVSLVPDPDDIIYFFGHLVTESTFRALTLIP